MAPRPTCLLALVLCLVHGILTRQGSLSQPSISAEPGSVISRGRNVTILCQANGGFELFRLEKCSPGNGPTFKDEKNTSSFQKEARFAFTLMNPGCYVCIYQKSSTWSPRSEKLNLTVADADVTQASIPTASAVASDSTSPGATEVLVDRGPFGPAWLGTSQGGQQATADRPPQQGASTLLQGPQEVTYAQLDHRTLTQRGNREVSPQAMAEPCMYAVITR
ncbi:leukocyte-associated immunoglobulin-like receptor 1 isoform X7 [Cavia porcellus]|uniref:leukocyte-associated immunoglobulin-like receptor 1 isoform X7 n=1 Tax=Cavia porcellus TaxID=10141 RepID=UPI002FE1DDE6